MNQPSLSFRSMISPTSFLQTLKSLNTHSMEPPGRTLGRIDSSSSEKFGLKKHTSEAPGETYRILPPSGKAKFCSLCLCILFGYVSILHFGLEAASRSFLR